MPVVTTRCAPSLVIARARDSGDARGGGVYANHGDCRAEPGARVACATDDVDTSPNSRVAARTPLARCVMTTRLKSTGRDAPPLDPDSAHDARARGG